MSCLFDRACVSNLIQEIIPSDWRNVSSVVINNVADYFYKYWKVTERKIDYWKDFPTVVPPFAPMFMEYKAPMIFGFADKWFGALFYTYDLEESIDESKIDKYLVEVITKSKELGARWVLDVVMVFEGIKYSPAPLRTIFTFPLKSSGEFYSNPNHSDIPFAFARYMGEEWLNNRESYDLIGVHEFQVEHGKEYEKSMGQAFKYLLPMFLAISFTHCKNVRLDRVNPSLKLNKKFNKNYGRSLLKYQVINIEPMKQVLSKEGNVNINGLEKALHICRGHFKTFGGEHKKLFGKIEGRYFWPQSLRGNPEHGIIKSTYNVDAPKESMVTSNK